MTSPVISIDADADLSEATAAFGSNRVGRLPTVRDGQFVGMITADDVLISMASDLAQLVSPIRSEVVIAHHDNPVPATA